MCQAFSRHWGYSNEQNSNKQTLGIFLSGMRGSRSYIKYISKCIGCQTVISVGGNIAIFKWSDKESLTRRVSFILQRNEEVSRVKADGEKHHRQMD